MIDLVVPYVNSDDPKWLYQKKLVQGRHNTRVGSAKAQRFRDLNTFKYALRSIAKYAPWINTVYVVLQMPSQKPEWLKESDRLKIIYHDQIIPKKLLPTYNSGTIECFVWKIPNLSEKFIYINDDMIATKSLAPEDFYEGDCPKVNIVKKPYRVCAYQSMLKTTERLIKSILKINNPEEDIVYRDGHSWTPMLKSTWELIFKESEDYIIKHCSTFRGQNNIVQQVATYYQYFTNKIKPREILTKYITADGITPDILENNPVHIICLNDSSEVDAVKENISDTIEAVFNKILKDKCIYENS